MNLDIIMKVGKRDALALYEYYFNAREGSVDKLENTSYELLAIGLNKRGCKTSRGADFTTAVARSCVAELERAGAALRIETKPGQFDLVLPEFFQREADAMNASEREETCRKRETA